MEERKLSNSCDILARLNGNDHTVFENENHCIKPLSIKFHKEDAENLINDKDSNDSTKVNRCINSSKISLPKDTQVATTVHESYEFYEFRSFSASFEAPIEIQA